MKNKLKLNLLKFSLYDLKSMIREAQKKSNNAIKNNYADTVGQYYKDLYKLYYKEYKKRGGLLPLNKILFK